MEFPLAEGESRNSTWNKSALRPELYTCHLYVMTSTKPTALLSKWILSGRGSLGAISKKQHQSLKGHYFFLWELVNKDSDRLTCLQATCKYPDQLKAILCVVMIQFTWKKKISLSFSLTSTLSRPKRTWEFTNIKSRNQSGAKQRAFLIWTSNKNIFFLYRSATNWL